MKPNPFRFKSSWCPPSDRDPRLDIYINSIESDIMNARSTRIHDNLTRRERQALKKLQRPTDVIIKPADKGSGTVVMDRQNYLDDPTDDINKRARFWLKDYLPMTS